MTSAGGLVDAATYRSMDSLLSGPAGGVVGAALAGSRSGKDRVIAFDMGGTSTDVARFDADFEYVFSHRVGPVDLAVPALAIEKKAVTYFAVVLLVVAGVASYFELGQLKDPDFTVKTALVITRYPGASPKEVEELIVKPLEAILQGMNGVEHTYGMAMHSMGV